MEKELISIGLSPSEAKVYIALLELGEATVSEVAKRGGINRTAAYDVISRLIEIGLATKGITEPVQRYQAEPPAKLPLVLEQRVLKATEQAKKSKRLAGELNMLIKSKFKKPQVRLFEGNKGIKELYEDTLLSKEPIRAFEAADQLVGFDPEYINNYFVRRAKKKLFIKAIVADSAEGRRLKKLDPDQEREIRLVPPEMLDIKPEVYFYENKVAFFSLNERFAVLIESADIAKALKSLYDLAWEKAKEYDERAPMALPPTSPASLKTD